jgi:hypothetical protein
VLLTAWVSPIWAARAGIDAAPGGERNRRVLQTVGGGG